MSLLNTKVINGKLKKMNEWKFQNNAISRSFDFSTYMSGISYVQTLALLAEKENHHPNITIGWCRINIEFTSHDLGGVTEKCIYMAILATKLFEEQKSE